KRPCRATASAAYSEQLGTNRHAGGSNGETRYLYTFKSLSAAAFIVLRLSEWRQIAAESPFSAGQTLGPALIYAGAIQHPPGGSTFAVEPRLRPAFCVESGFAQLLLREPCLRRSRSAAQEGSRRAVRSTTQ